jgi:hypothetical protein
MRAMLLLEEYYMIVQWLDQVIKRDILDPDLDAACRGGRVARIDGGERRLGGVHCVARCLNEGTAWGEYQIDQTHRERETKTS